MNTIKNVRIFSPCFRVPVATLRRTIDNFLDLRMILERRQLDCQILLINDDPENDEMSECLEAQSQAHDFISVHRNDRNLGNSEAIQLGYSWVLNENSNTLGGSCDADGEHHPLAFAFYIDKLLQNECDGVIGSIVYPDHGDSSLDNRSDRAFMRSIGFDQAQILGLKNSFSQECSFDGALYVQAPGFQLHNAAFIQKAMDLLPIYTQEFIKQFGEFPKWGMHFVVDALLSLAGANMHAAYLPCFGMPPARDRSKRWLQLEAALKHMQFFENSFRKLDRFKSDLPPIAISELPQRDPSGIAPK